VPSLQLENGFLSNFGVTRPNYFLDYYELKGVEQRPFTLNPGLLPPS